MPGCTSCDVLIVGAGLSGVGAAAQLKRHCPGKTFILLESRAAIGGTWDLFRYPGIRSDSDMHTLGYEFRPWTASRAIADGASIRRYIEDTAREHGIEPHIRFGQRVRSASWSSQDALWTVHAEVVETGEPVQFTCRIIDFCSGYFRYDVAHRPAFPGETRFKGPIVHPQFWPAGLDHSGRRVVVIGSGATAMTLVPEMARTASRVTLLQRSPTYVVALPAHDRIAAALKRVLPQWLAYRLVRTKNILLGSLFFALSRRWPDRVRTRLIERVAEQLGPGHDVRTDFSPTYKPWDQRICLVPDGDLFEAIRGGRAEVVTGTIETFTERGIQLASGQHLDADIIATATGLTLQWLGGAAISVDGEPVDFPRKLTYKAMMFDGVPNLVQTFGYTNASWTLKADLTARYLCRLIKHMDRHHQAIATPRLAPDVQPRPFLDFTSGYVLRAADQLPRQGDRRPWRLYQNYLLDLLTLRFGRIEDGTLQLSPAPRRRMQGQHA